MIATKSISVVRRGFTSISRLILNALEATHGICSLASPNSLSRVRYASPFASQKIPNRLR